MMMGRVFYARILNLWEEKCMMIIGPRMDA